jgi:phosphate starvation-inducible PhoH-like protein
MVVAIGPAGTGKTFLAVAEALREVLNHNRPKLIITRPVVEAGESLGFLPGDLGQKIHPYLRPLYDAMDTLASPEMVRRLEETRVLEVAPLAYMRGRTLANSYVILDEAQNTTREQMKMFLTRIGEGSKVVVTGDITQVDIPRKADSGLIHIASILSPLKQISFVRFDQTDVVRSALVREIVRAYEEAEAPTDAAAPSLAERRGSHVG